MNHARIEQIRDRLERALQPTALDIRDDSHKHIGHPGARDGRGHFHVRIVTQRFRDLPMLARHRQIYAALDELMQTDIHALSIEALTDHET